MVACRLVDRHHDPFGWVVEHKFYPWVALVHARRAQFHAALLVDSQALACLLVRHVCRPCLDGLPNRFLGAFFAPMTDDEIGGSERLSRRGKAGQLISSS